MADFMDRLLGTATEEEQPLVQSESFMDRLLGSEPPAPSPAPVVQQQEQVGVSLPERSLATLGAFARWLFDLYSRGQYLSANVMDAATTLGSTPQDLLQAARQGITGEKKGDYIDWVKKTFPYMPEWWQVPTGLMLNILLDPLTYISFGKSIPAKAASRALIRVFGKSLFPEKVNKAVFDTIDHAVDAIKGTRAGQWIVRHFSTRGRFTDEELWRYYQESRDEANYLVHKAIENNVPLEQAVREVEQRTGFPRDVITDFIERPVYVKEEPIEEVFIKGGNLPPGYTKEIGRIRTLQDVREAEDLLLDLYMDHIADRLMSGALGDVWKAYERPEVVEVIRNRQTTHPLWSEIRELARRQLDAGGEKLRGFPKEWADLWDTLRLLEDPEFHTTRIRTRTVEYPRLELQDQSLQDLFADFTRRSEQRIAAELAEGIAISPFESDVLNYVTHILDPEARRFIERAKKRGREIDIERLINATVQHPSTKERTLGRNLSIKEINELAQRGELIPGYKGKLLIDDPVKINLIRDVMSARAIAAARFIKRVVNNPDMARPVAVAGPEFRELSGAAKERFGPLVEGIAFRNDIADALEEYVVRVSDPKNISEFVDAYNAFINIWKRYTLGWSLTWVANNILGNLWNGVLLAGSSPINMAKGANILLTGKGSVRGMSANEVLELAERHGVLWTGLYGDRLERTLRDALGQGSTWERAVTAPTEPLFIANQGVENAARLGLFIDGLEKGMSPSEAAMRVKKYLFDYSDLTETEKKIRQVVPFYAWMRKNIPLQVEALITTPGRQAVLPKVYNALQAPQDVLLPGEAKPEWMQEGVYPQVGMEGGTARFMSMRGIPLVDFIEMVQHPTAYFLSANPLLSAIAAWNGIDVYSARELDKTRGVMVLPGVVLPEPQAEALFSIFPPLQTISRITAPRFDPLLPQKSIAERVLENAGLRFYDRSYPEDLVNALQDATERMSIAQSRMVQAQMAGDEALVAFYQRMLEQAQIDYLTLITQLGVTSSPAKP